jgi:hypothetical protein
MGVGQSNVTKGVYVSGALSTASYGPNHNPARNNTEQGGFQIVGWVISVLFGAAAGGIIGFCYWLLNTHTKAEEFFTDTQLYGLPKKDQG